MAALYTVSVSGPGLDDFAVLDSSNPTDLLAELDVQASSPRARFTVSADQDLVREFIEFAAGRSGVSDD